MGAQPRERIGIAGAQRTQQLTGAFLLLLEIHEKPPSCACVRMQAERGSIDRRCRRQVGAALSADRTRRCTRSVHYTRPGYCCYSRDDVNAQKGTSSQLVTAEGLPTSVPL